MTSAETLSWCARRKLFSSVWVSTMSWSSTGSILKMYERIKLPDLEGISLNIYFRNSFVSGKVIWDKLILLAMITYSAVQSSTRIHFIMIFLFRHLNDGWYNKAVFTNWQCLHPGETYCWLLPYLIVSTSQPIDRRHSRRTVRMIGSIWIKNETFKSFLLT